MIAQSSMNRLALAAALILSACAKGPPPAPVSNAPAVSATAIDEVQTLLLTGKERDAQKQLKILLKRDPMNPSLLMLQSAIQTDAKEALGPANYPYVVRAGEMIGDLAQRFLGNRLKAYQLARYNDLTLPAQLVAGQTLRIPGSLAKPKPQPVPERVPPKASPAGPTPAKPKPVPPVARPATNPAAAQRARAAGLAALNRGAVGQAVGQLERAQALDPGNVQIQRDLQRARRIAATVKARR
jgi:hypothetical protein